jgi:hypothetical protein
MLLSKDELFSDDQAITATARSTNIIDLGSLRGLPDGTPVRVLIQVTETFETLTSLKVDICSDADETISGGTPGVLASSAAVAAASLVAGYRYVLEFIPGGTVRYVDLNYTVAGSNATAGKITAGIIAVPQTNYRG